MTEITTKYNLDFGDTFQKLESLAETVGTVDEVMRKKRGNPVYEEYARSATKFNQTLGQQIQINRQIEASTNSFKAELKRLEGVYADLKKRQGEFIASGNYDELLRDLDKIQKRMKELKGEVDKTAGVWDKLKGFMNKPAGGGLLSELGSTIGLTLGVGEAIRRTVVDWAAYSKKLSEVSAITGATGKNLQFLSDAALEAEAQTGIAATEILEGFKQVGSIRAELLEDKQALADVTKEVVALAQASGLSLPEAAQAAVGALNQFGEKSDQAGRFVNVLAAGALKGASEVNDTAAALQNAGTAMSAAGLSFEQGNALIQSLAGVMIKGSEAGTGLRNVILKLETDTDKTLRPSIVGLDKALENAAKKYDTTSELAKVFGAENIVVARRVLESREEISKMTKELTGTEVAYEQQRKQLDNLSADLDKAGNAITGFFRSLGQSQDGFLRQLVQGFTLAVQAITKKTGELQAFWRGATEDGAWMNPITSFASGVVEFNKQREANLVAARSRARVLGIKQAANQSVDDDQEALKKAAIKRGVDEPQAIREAAQKVAKARETDYLQARADHNKLRQEYEKAGADRRKELASEFEASRQRILFAETARKKATSEAQRLDEADKQRQAKLKSLLSEPKTEEEKKAQEKALKNRQEANRLLEKAEEEYQKEIQKLEEQFGKDQLNRLDRNSEEYLNKQAELQKQEIEMQRQHLIKLGQLATSNETRKNKQTGQLEAIPNLNYQLPIETQALFAIQLMEIERKKGEDIVKLREEKRLQMLSLERRFDELEIEEAKRKWDELIKKEKDGSAEQLRLRELKQKDLTRLGLQQALTANDGQEQVAMSILDRQFKPTNMREVDFEKYKQEKILEITIEYAEKRLAFLEAIGEKENVVQIEQVKTLIAKSKQELNLLQSQPKQFSNIYELLGIKFANSEQEKQFMEATSLILDSVKQATDAIIAESDRRLQAIENEISAKQKQVDDEKARAEEGAANNLAIRQRELDDLKAKKAEEEQVKRRALRVQQVIDTAMLVSTNAVTAANLIAAAAASFRSAAQSSFNPILGVIQAIAAIATIFATVASVRARAKAITQFRSGGKLRGPKHEQGGIPGTGYFDDIEVEGGEHVTNAKSSDRYDKTLTALNQNNPKKAFQALLLEGFGMPQIAIDRLNNQPVQVTNQSIDFSRLEQKIGSLQDELRAIRQNTGKNVVGVGDKLITVEGNKRTIEKLK